MKYDIKKGLASIVVPIYNEVDSLIELYEKLSKAFEPTVYNFEVILVDDGSNDGSVEVEEKLSSEHENVIVEKFLRNKGKAAALDAGFKLASGEFVATIDADLQDDPFAIPEMIKKIQDEGLDLVSGWKQNRQDPFIKRNTSKIFNFFTRLLTGIKLHDFNNGLKVYRSEVIKNIKVYGEMHRYIPVLAKQQGFNSGEHKVKHFARQYGETKYGISRFYKGFLDLLTVVFITKFMKRPMHFFGIWGMAFVTFGFVCEFYVLILKYFFNHPFKNHFAMMLMGVLLLISGVQFFSIGLISELITFHNKKDT